MRVGFAWVNYLTVLALTVAGCRSSSDISFDQSYPHYRSMAQTVDYPDVRVPLSPESGATSVPRPPTVRRFEDLEYVGLSLEDAIRTAIDNNETVRQAGGVILRAPNNAATIYDPAIQETDPRTGIEGALSLYDAQVDALLSGANNQRELNLTSLLPTRPHYREEQGGIFNFGVSKLAATGTQMRVDQTTRYLGLQFSNADGQYVPGFNGAPTIYETTVNATVRHPLMQGGGTEFNRIAGPGAGPGTYRGVLIARINNDVALIEFQTAVRNLLRDVERGYWELYFAYRDLDAKMHGRRYAVESWELEKRRVDGKSRPPDQEAYAREQYYAAQAAVENAISGERGQGGILGAERELRSLMGLPAVDGKLLRPTTRPLTIDIQFDWDESLNHGLTRREEVRRQRWRVKQRELELVAARNFTLPTLNAIGRYSFRGFGDNLLGNDADSNGLGNALNDLGELRSWLVGLEYQAPVGRRAGHAAVRNAELGLRRDQAILIEQERQIGLELRGAFTELDRAYVVTRSSYNRHVAAQIQLEAERRRNAEGATRLDLVLEAQRRAVIAEVAFHRAIVDYNQALSAVNFFRGTLFESLDVYLTEGPWSAESHDSAQRQAYRYVPRQHHEPVALPPPISLGEMPQRTDGRDGEPTVEIIPPPPREDAGP